jgi:hypothetical protein
MVGNYRVKSYITLAPLYQFRKTEFGAMLQHLKLNN